MPFVDPPPAIIAGYPARVLAVWLGRAVARGAFDELQPVERRHVLAAVRAIELAGEAWYQRRPSAVIEDIADLGNSETLLAEIGARSSHGDHCSIDEAAAALGVSARRARQLAAAGLGHKVGAVWVVDRGALLAELERRAA